MDNKANKRVVQPVINNTLLFSVQLRLHLKQYLNLTSAMSSEATQGLVIFSMKIN